MKLMLKGGRLLDPAAGLDEIFDIVLIDGVIINIGKDLSEDDFTVIDVRGKIVIADTMDMHVHLREPGREDAETIKSGTKAACAGGITKVLAMPNTQPPVDNTALVNFIKTAAYKDGACIVYPSACITKGQAGLELSEMGELFREGAIAFTDDGKPVTSSYVMRRALEYSKMTKAPIISHCEDIDLASGGVMHEGYYSTVYGLKGIPSQADEVMIGRDIMLCELTGGRLHIAHLSTKGSVDLVRMAKEKGLPVTAEVTINHLLLTDERLLDYDTSYKIKPPLRSEEDRNALIEGVSSGIIDAIVSDHAPHTQEDKEADFDIAPFGISGVETLLKLLYYEMIVKEKLPLNRAIDAITRAPHRILGLNYSSFNCNQRTNLTIIDPNRIFCINRESLISKGKNSPFHGWKGRGAPLFTIINGKVYVEGEILQDISQLNTLAFG